MTALASPPDARTSSPAPVLPAWPLLVLFYGFPLIWAAGALQFAPAALACVMLALLVVRRRIVLPRLLWVYSAFLVWAAASFPMLQHGNSWLGFALRWSNLLAALVFMAYYYNARHSITHRHLLRGMLVVWATTVLLGCLALVLPEARFTTPIGMLLPGSITSNALVQNLVFPPLAEVQSPGGVPEPYVRPSAPFAYANSWGVAFVVLTPLVMAYLFTVRLRARHLLVVAGLGVSLIPAVATSNRGMFLGILVAMVYVLVRWALQGRTLPSVAGAAVLGCLGVWLVASGAVAEILGRQQYSDSTGGRAALYRATYEAVLGSPLLGYGGPRLEESVGVYMGTQGYLWTIMFSYGFVGLTLFVVFLFGSTLTTARFRSAGAALVHSVPVAACVFFVFYGLDVLQFLTVCMCLAMMLRARDHGEQL